VTEEENFRSEINSSSSMVDGGFTLATSTGGIHYNENQYVHQKEYRRGGGVD
jgi:hypothetical protein